MLVGDPHNLSGLPSGYWFNPDAFKVPFASGAGITIVDPRWHRTKDTVKKFVMMVPLRDAAGENVGGLVLAYKVPSPVARSETEFFAAASALRDELKPRIASHADLFKPAN